MSRDRDPRDDRALGCGHRPHAGRREVIVSRAASPNTAPVVTATPAEAAQLLGYSRPFAARLLDEGELPSAHLPGSTHRTVRLADVLEFQARRERNAEGRRRISEIVEDHDLPY